VRKSATGDILLSKQIGEVKKLVKVGLVEQNELAGEIAEIKRILMLPSGRVSPELEAAIQRVSLTARQIDRKVKD
jgi:hypothetical protein